MRLVQSFAGGAVNFSGEITAMPGFRGMAISHAVYQHEGGKSGFGTKALQKRMAQCKSMGYSAMLCSVNEKNVVQKKLLARCGWSPIATHKNAQTGNNVQLWSVQLT